VAVSVGGVFLVSLMLAWARSMAWVMVVPGFSTRAIPSVARGFLALGLALPVTPRLEASVPSADGLQLLSMLLIQVVTGAALGFVVMLLLAAVAAAGDLIDLFGGFSLGMAYDPLGLAASSVFGRFHQLLAITLLFATQAHLVVVDGFLRSYDAIPLNGGISTGGLAQALTAGVGRFFVSSLEIAAPLVAVLLISDVGLGLLTRVAPTLNALSLGFPIKILLTMCFIGATFTVLPGTVMRLVQAAGHLLGG
jgi:flagellar biosynthetic protein FliR